MAAKKRTLSLNEELDAKLVELCEELSVSPNNYINNVLAKAVLNDRTAFVAQQTTSEGMDKMLEIFTSLASQDESTSNN